MALLSWALEITFIHGSMTEFGQGRDMLFLKGSLSSEDVAVLHPPLGPFSNLVLRMPFIGMLYRAHDLIARAQ